MQWGHIKTLFILSFLILNIYLITALIDRQQDIGYLDNRELPIEDQLAAAGINYDSIQVDVTQSTYISAGQKELTDEDLSALEGFQNQSIEVLTDNLIVSELKQPIGITKKMGAKEFESIIQSNVLYGEEYSFWDWSEELKVLIFFQVKEDRMIYFNENGLLLLFVNDRNEITHYAQTILGESVVQGEPVQLNQPTQVIGQLFNANYLNRGDEVTDLKIGYYSRIAAEGTHVFAPTWKVTVNDERSHFVNAIEGIIYENDQTNFLLEVINDYSLRIQTLDEGNKWKESMLPILEKRIER